MFHRDRRARVRARPGEVAHMEQRVLRTVTLRLVPFLVLLYVIAYID
jgi:hypothetical protein